VNQTLSKPFKTVSPFRISVVDLIVQRECRRLDVDAPRCIGLPDMEPEALAAIQRLQRNTLWNV
jgi:hypothetical protein